MSVTHRTLVGDWELCGAPDTCELLFHFPDVTPAEMAAVPERVLWELLEVVDPPQKATENFRVFRFATDTAQMVAKAWLDYSRWAVGTYHRGYDLPAIIRVGGTAEWAFEGQFHRAGGRPAIVYADGRPAEFWEHGVRVR